MKHILFALAFWISSATAFAAVPQAGFYPGGVAVVELKPNTRRALFGNQAVWIQGNYGVFALPLSLKPGAHELDTNLGPIKFQIGGREYPEQRITLANTQMVSPNEERLARIRREAIEQRAWYQLVSERQPALPMALPLEGPITGAFGRKRFFNDQPRRPHSGVDIAAPSGTPIGSPTSGVVVGIGDYYFNGKTVFIDHGKGIISMMCHLSEIDVTPGQEVVKGQVVGKVGATGRATGPHLHWTVSFNNTRVEPELFAPDLKDLPR